MNDEFFLLSYCRARIFPAHFVLAQLFPNIEDEEFEFTILPE
jgi:hypothetical protein